MNRKLIESKLNTALPKDCELLTEKSIRLPARSDKSNKGTYGKVTVVGGAPGMAGAICLAAEAAARSGAGLVKAVTSCDGVTALNRRMPEIMTSAALDENDLSGLKEAVEWADSVLVGPGLGRDERAARVLETVLDVFSDRKPNDNRKDVRRKKHLVLDADALFLLSAGNDLFERLPEETILTPHMGELSKLTGISVSELKAGIFDIAGRLTYNNSLIYVCKDACTVVSFKGKNAANTSGNNGMSTGGCGDVLAGLTAGFSASGEDAYECAKAAVFVHGLAGDLAAERLSAYCVTATSLLKDLPSAMKTVLKAQKMDNRGNK